MRWLVLLLVACTHAPPERASQPPPPGVPPPPVPPADAAAPLAAPIDAAVLVDAVRVDAPKPIDAAVVVDAAATTLRACPASYAAAARGTCALDEVDKLACKYPAGHCECHELVPCAGWAGAYEEARKHPRAQWTCTPAVRADGCPGDPPREGSRCTKAAQECPYTPCGGSVLTCVSGGWKVTRQIGGPP